VAARDLEGLARRLGRHGFAPRLQEPSVALSAAFDRRLPRLQALPLLVHLRKERADHVLGVTDLALTDGVREWVYGLGGGLSGEVFLDRLSAALLHELAHNVGMVHCRNGGCLMHATHEPARMRQLELAFCASCDATWRRRIQAAPSTARAASSRASRRTP
jgi:hypothetical protein